MDLSSIEQIIRTQVPNAPDSDVELYLDSVQRDMKFGGDYSDMSEDDIVEDFEFYIQSRMDEAQKPSMKMKSSDSFSNSSTILSEKSRCIINLSPNSAQ